MEMPVEISLVFRDHPDEDVLEEYALGRLNDAKAAVLEEHILVCEHCQSALAETDDYIRLMKFAASRPLEIPPRRSGKRAAIAAGVLTAASIAVFVLLKPNPPPASVTLASYRGGAAGSGGTMGLGGAGVLVNRAAAGHPLDLSISAADVPPAAEYHLEVVTSTGKSIWNGPVSAGDGRLSAHLARSLSAEMYWVRLYALSAPRAELLAEYGLQVK
jgi:anti-sigma factor RsiW